MQYLMSHRVGQLLVSTLPTDHQADENTISLYQQDPTHEDEGENPTHHAHLDSSHDDDKQRRAIILRNMLLDVILSLLTTDTLVLNIQ